MATGVYLCIYIYIYILLWLEVPECINYSRGVRSIRRAERRNVLLELNVHLLCVYSTISVIVARAHGDTIFSHNICNAMKCISHYYLVVRRKGHAILTVVCCHLYFFSWAMTLIHTSALRCWFISYLLSYYYQHLAAVWFDMGSHKFDGFKQWRRL